MIDIFVAALIAILTISLVYCIITIIETNRVIRHEEEEIMRMRDEFLCEFYKEEASKSDEEWRPN